MPAYKIFINIFFPEIPRFINIAELIMGDPNTCVQNVHIDAFPALLKHILVKNS